MATLIIYSNSKEVSREKFAYKHTAELVAENWIKGLKDYEREENYSYEIV